MHVWSMSRKKIELEYLQSSIDEAPGGALVRAAGVGGTVSSRLTRAASTFFHLSLGPQLEGITKTIAQEIKKEPPIGVFRDKESGLLKMVHKEIVLRFDSNASETTRKKILKKHSLEVRAVNPYIRDQVIVRSKKADVTGVELVDLANQCMDETEIVFAGPNFVSEYRRTAISIPSEQWHLKNTAAVMGQKLNEDVKASAAWSKTSGKNSITVAVLDDGVDVDHPNLKAAIRKISDPGQPLDKLGRDFFVPDGSPDHFDPRPKNFQFPYDKMSGNDIHGTPCVGIIVAQGKNGGAVGIAPKCRVLAVKIFHGDNLASDDRVADAIRYSCLHADILSCSWSGGSSPNIEAAITVDAAAGRGGKGCAVFCAAGNDGATSVSFPANLPAAIAVGASTDQAKLASYSNTGPEISIVAPSSGGKQGIYTTDVSLSNRGFNLGSVSAGGTNGFHTNSFGGTSSATPLAAGVAALVLSVNPKLDRQQLKEKLQDTADKIGSGYNATGHSNRFGFGRVNAEEAVK